MKIKSPAILFDGVISSLNGARHDSCRAKAQAVLVALQREVMIFSLADAIPSSANALTRRGRGFDPTFALNGKLENESAEIPRFEAHQFYRVIIV